MIKKKEKNPLIYREDNSYQKLLEVESICSDLRHKGYNKKSIRNAISVLKKVIELEEL